jgi:hypothetical protein
MAIIGDTELSATKQDLIAARVQRELLFAAKLASLFSDKSQFAVKGMQSISFPKLTSFSAPDRASGVAGVPQAMTSTVDKMDLNHRPYVSWLVDSNDEVQSTLNFQLEAAGRAGSAHGRRFDTEVITELEAVGVATAVAGAFDYARSLDMRDELLSREGNMDNAAWIMSGDSEKALLGIPEYNRQDVYGPNGAIRAGQMGTLFGAPVIRHNALAASTYYLADAEGIAYGFQRSPSIKSESDIDYGTDAIKWAMDALFGVKGQQIEQAGVAAGLSALVVKDANV